MLPDQRFVGGIYLGTSRDASGIAERYKKKTGKNNNEGEGYCGRRKITRGPNNTWQNKYNWPENKKKGKKWRVIFAPYIK